MKKKEKLELMLNKVVEYNNPKANKGKGSHFKAFLYKNASGYYFKVVEIVTDDNIEFNDIIFLKKGDENLIIVADKPKLMRISKNSWHYRLLKYVMRDNAPTPKDMQNGCPYFWLLVASLFAIPFILLFKAVKLVVMLIPKMLFWVLEQMVNSWVAGLDDEAAYDMYYNGSYGNANVKMPKTAKLYFDNSDDDFFDFFLSKKYKDISKDDPDYAKKRNEMKEKWKIWRADLQKRRAEQNDLNYERQKKRDAARRAIEKKRAISKAKWDAKMLPFRTWRTNTASWFSDTFTVERGRRNTIIKRTKQLVGAIVTVMILVGTFFAVNYISLGLMWLADLCITNWVVFVGLAICVIFSGIIYLLYVVITSWGQNIINKYNGGRKLWYVEPFIYLIWYPVKYIALSIAFIVAKIIWLPVKFIFYTCLWQSIVWLAQGLWRAIRGLGRGIGSSTGIFGEYFGASYSDYCPGIEWCDFEDED